MKEMRRCKECGKMFVPKGREQYCPDTHYRPCPVCGKPVIVKYYNDPARRCDNCKWRKMPPLPKELAAISKSPYNFIPKNEKSAGEALKQEAEILEELEKKSPFKDIPGWSNMLEPTVPDKIDPSAFCETLTGAVRVYIGTGHKNNFIPGHEYVLKVERDDYNYVVSSAEDVTAEENCDCFLPFASQVSFHQHFGKMRKRGEHSGIGHNGW